MIPVLERADVERFRTLVARRLGLNYDGSRMDALTDALRQRMEALDHGRSASYLEILQSPARGRDEWRALAERLTVAETYFFRDPGHFQVLAEVALPERIRARGGLRNLRILSAGCASGEEAYSVAITVRDRLPDAASRPIEIVGIDVNGAMIEKARRARYTVWALRETPETVRDRHFRPDGREFALDAAIRERVSFEERNLVEEAADFWRPDAFDVVFCRNVTMYFPLEITRAVVARMTGSIVPDGFLFLGHAETLRGISQDFHLRHTHETFYYQRRGAAEVERAPLLPFPFAPETGPAPPAPILADLPPSWVDAIGGASERIARLADQAGGREPAPRGDGTPQRRAKAGTPAPTPSRDLGPAVELLRQERFADALDILRRLPPGSSVDPDAQLLRAVLLTNCGDRAEAEEVCRQILAADDLNAGAHYLAALCREHAGDFRGAVERGQTAVYLDPAFAMPRLHLGLMARRAGDLDSARRELEHALILLAREDASRILLFGGGFSRDALARLCRSELRACGGVL